MNTPVSPHIRLLRVRSALTGLALLASAHLAPAASVTGSVNWASTTGAFASDRHYGLNTSQGFNPAISPGNATYRTNMQYMSPGMIRFQRPDQRTDSSSNADGWIVSPGTSSYHWDSTKINNAMNALTQIYGYGPDVMMTIVNWPDFLDDRNGKLQTSKYGAYATHCANLVQIININQGRGIKYWEIFNEKDPKYGTNCAELARIYDQAARAMLAVDPTIKIGGAGFGQSSLPRYGTSRMNDFLATVAALGSPFTFVSFHDYPNSDNDSPPTFDSTDASIYNLAANLGSNTTAVRNLVTANFANPGAIEIFQDEYNINWHYNGGVSPSFDPRMNNMKGGIFDALSMISVVNALGDGAMAWCESGDAFGKLDNSQALRPAGHVYHLFNLDMTGSVVTTTTSDSSKVVVFAQKLGLLRKVGLVNRSGASQTVQLSFSGWSKVPAGTANFTMNRAAASGFTTSTVSYSTVTGSTGLTLPADTVTSLTFDEKNLWTSADIGSVGLAGSTTFSSAQGLFTVNGAGADVNGTADSFRFVYVPFTGNGRIVAKVLSVENTNAWAKAGVMMREAITNNARYALIDVTPSNGIEFLRRLTTGGTRSATFDSGPTAPYWVRLVRSGNTITASKSTDGSNWVQVGTDTISMASTIYFGVVVCSHNTAQLNTSTFNNVWVGP